eukprot:15469847-Alexandrium_andersonii.AAC.1
MLGSASQRLLLRSLSAVSPPTTQMLTELRPRTMRRPKVQRREAAGRACPNCGAASSQARIEDQSLSPERRASRAASGTR